VLDGKALLARFRHPERQREEPVFAAAFHTLQAHAQIETVAELPHPLRLEGAGDCIWDEQRGHFWMGCSQRSDRAAADVVADQFDVDCVALELADPSFYHLDTAFCALPTGDVTYYPGTFVPEAQGAVEKRIAPAQRITLERAEAMRALAPMQFCLITAWCYRAAPRRCGVRSKNAASRSSLHLAGAYLFQSSTTRTALPITERFCLGICAIFVGVLVPLTVQRFSNYGFGFRF